MEEMSGKVQNAALTNCDAEIKSTRTTDGQFKGQFSGAMEHYTWVRFAAKLTACHRTHIAKVSIPVGRWRTCLGKGRRQTHILRFVRIHVGVGQRCDALNVEPPALQVKKQSA